MHRGYVKLWRKSLKSPTWQNHNLWRFWCYCLMKATHTGITEIVGFQEVKLEKGEFVFGRKIAAEEVGLSEQQIRTCLTKLKNMKNLTIKTTNKFSIISIVNWEEYQGEPTSKITSSQPASNQQLTTNKNDKNNKNDKKFIVPTIEEVTDYCNERKNGVNPVKWINHYTARGWMAGKNKMVDWKAAVRTWEDSNGNTPQRVTAKEIPEI